MTKPEVEGQGEEGAVAAYKAIFKAVLDKRPSGMRLKLAQIMGKNRSFISQIGNATYPVPIPVQHLNTIFEACHVSPAERAAFLEAYGRAHPRHAGRLGGVARERAVTLHVTDLGSRKRNGQLDSLLHDFARRLVGLLLDDK